MLRSTEARYPGRFLVLGLALLSARIAVAACGDGVLDAGEACDDGNVAAGDCCDPTCAAEPAGSACPGDGNPCSLDVCDAGAVCTHPTGGTAPCDDGDSCTTNDVCGDGVCAGTSIPETCVDPVLCRRARPTASVAQRGVGVDDGFTVFGATLSRPADLCLPATTTGAPLLDSATALVSSHMRNGLIPLLGSWHITDQFGQMDVQSHSPDRLMVASSTSATPPPPAPPAPGSTNHYGCRRVSLTVGSDSPRGALVTVDDGAGARVAVLRRPRRLCRPADVDAPRTGMAHPNAVLMCYGVRMLDGASGAAAFETSNQLGTAGVRAFGERELCVPAVATPAPKPCVTSGDECGLPCCREFVGQHPLCTYDPVVADPVYLGCAGPTILFDRTHANFHQVNPESNRNPGRFWGFAKLLVRDGYVVKDSKIPFATLFPAVPAKILAIANPRALIGPDAIPAPEIAALVDWVEQGGSLLLSIDHPPFDKTDALLAALGLEQIGRSVREFTFTLANGGLNPSSPITTGIGEVTTFTGTAFRIASAMPQATYDPILTFPPDSPSNADGWFQAMTMQFGAGRIYLSAESGGLTAQNTFGMQETPDNEQYVRNIVHWLDY